MFGFGDGQEQYENYHGEEFERHKASGGHELLAGAAAFGGMYEWEKMQRDQGKPVSHAFAKELLAGLAGAEVDKLVESKGRDKWEEHEIDSAKRKAKANADDLYNQQYGGRDEWRPEYQPHVEHNRHHERRGEDRW